MAKENVQLDRVVEKPLTIFGKPVRVKKLILIAFTGIFLGIMGYMELQAIGWMIFGLLNLALLIFSVMLIQKTILYFGENSIECSPSGDIFLTKLHGHCPRCDGHLKLVKKRKGLNEYIMYIQCDKDEKHIWNANATHKDAAEVKKSKK